MLNSSQSSQSSNIQLWYIRYLPWLRNPKSLWNEGRGFCRVFEPFWHTLQVFSPSASISCIASKLSRLPEYSWDFCELESQDAKFESARNVAVFFHRFDLLRITAESRKLYELFCSLLRLEPFSFRQLLGVVKSCLLTYIYINRNVFFVFAALPRERDLTRFKKNPSG